MTCKLDINEFMQVTQVLTLTAELFVIIIYLEMKVGYSYNFSCEYFSNNALVKDISMKESLLNPTSINGLNIEVTLVLGRSSKVKSLELGRNSLLFMKSSKGVFQWKKHHRQPSTRSQFIASEARKAVGLSRSLAIRQLSVCVYECV